MFDRDIFYFILSYRNLKDGLKRFVILCKTQKIIFVSVSLPCALPAVFSNAVLVD